MSLLIRCPHCGPRNIYEFRFGGEVKSRPDENRVTQQEWSDYVYLSKNVCGPQKEWWYHSKGCGSWFTLWRDTSPNLPIDEDEDGTP